MTVPSRCLLRIGSLAGDFEPDKYRDSYREEVLALIERKAQGEEITVPPTPIETREPAPDLMSALKASLAAVKTRDTAGDGAAKPRSTAKKPAARKAAARKPAAAKGAKKSGGSRSPAKR